MSVEDMRIGQEEYRPPLIDASILGGQDAMVVMRSKDKELCFVMRVDLPDEAFVRSCQALRLMVLGQ